MLYLNDYWDVPVKKFLFPLLTGVLLLSACTTPVSKLETDEQQGGGNGTAWDAEQQDHDEDPYAKYYQEGIPIFSELQTQVLRPAPIFGDPDSRENADELLMGTAGFFRVTTYTDENGQPVSVNESMSMGADAQDAGTYVVEFGCWGVGLATLQVFLDSEAMYPDVLPSNEIPLNCGIPAKTTEGVFEIDRAAQGYTILVSGEPETVGSFEVNLYRRNDG